MEEMDDQRDRLSDIETELVREREREMEIDIQKDPKS